VTSELSARSTSRAAATATHCIRYTRYPRDSAYRQVVVEASGVGDLAHGEVAYLEVSRVAVVRAVHAGAQHLRHRTRATITTRPLKRAHGPSGQR
jgi:hypothetical protein